MARRSDFTRREFLRNSGLFAAGVAGGQMQNHKRKMAPATRPLLNLGALTPFVDALPIPALIKSKGMRPSPEEPAKHIPYYRLAMREMSSKVHRDMKPTRMWGFGETCPGPTFETRSGEPLLVEWANELPAVHFLPLDHKVHGAESSKPDVRAVTHLHGAKAPPKSDGYPDDWFVSGKSATYYYPNKQEAAHLWYHDHALGITRLNVYAGLFGNFFVRDTYEDGLNLPKGKYEIPLTLCDRYFDADSQLFYPVSPDPQSPWLPEVFGDAVLVNGKLFPYLEVEPRKYRFRVLNAANGRFFHMTLSNGQQFAQIGCDLGFLAAPVPLKLLAISPGERADVIIDFAGHAGEQITITSDSLTIMQFRVSKAAVKDESSVPSSFRPIAKTPESAAVQNRILTLGEQDDISTNPVRMLLNNAHWDMPVTESPKLDSVEIWNLLNFTDDSHPIHLHAVRFQILDRRPFEPELYYHGGQIKFNGPAIPPAANEAGWKDTVQAYPGMITRIITKFEGFTGRYVWHCHILEHEDNEMMRPYDIVAP
jgi:spore coat protein A